jgi:hypothetical protein
VDFSFFQVLDLKIKREHLDDGLFKFYGMDLKTTGLPSLSLDDDVRLWGDRLLEGEAAMVYS